MKKRYISAVLLFALFFIVSSNSFDAKPLTDDFKNLKVLPQDITKQRLDSIMGTYAVSLGVRCNFCHAAWVDTSKRGLDFASDENQEKGIARMMMKMTSDINTNYFNFMHSNQTDTLHSVVCYTCHRGTKQPDSKIFIGVIDSTLKSFKKH